ncbi:TetR/AcrR family transcriptional regulator [Actinosynnema pretiosum subsp. pretiosum]|uniref:TetR/AcrR family transcriptional regulator n=1 Tax=Actinosynnema pretiosum subsp. pretiosum TaxID=103721 RepID=A0AA45R6X6_9PSEU|nr:Transcriptional regulator, TetR family [Actinosynnema pretiosum subsp. pretiosum]QUF07502.1 TetR/AcrR family transcriptional regulator [Actinosynnema pretiosum subsp. pretiosum]
MTAARPRGRRGQGALLRDDILAAATRLLDLGGEHRVTLRAVAREAGITAPSIYPHFPDPPSVLKAAADAGRAELAALLTASATRSADPRRRLHDACHAYLDFATTRPGCYRVMSDHPDETTPGAPTTGHLAALIAECAATGRSTSTDPEADAVALWLGLHGIAHQRAAHRLFPWPADLVPDLVTALSGTTRATAPNR